MVQITRKFTTPIYKSREGHFIEYIIIHATGNPGMNVLSFASYINKKHGNRLASAHYFVDDTQVFQFVKDEDCAFHIGGNLFLSDVCNENSIGVEISMYKGQDDIKTFNHTVQLVRKLMTEYNIPIEKVLRHYDVSRAICPASMAKDNWAAWYQFLKLCSE